MFVSPTRNTFRARLSAVLFSLGVFAVGPSAAIASARHDPAVERREVGALVLENIPETPKSVTESWKRYDGARPVLFLDWLKDGSMLYATFAAQGPQVFAMKNPGAAGVQVTQFSEPVMRAVAQPGSNNFVFMKDTGGNEQYQGFLRSENGAVTQFTETGTRNGDPVFSRDGLVMVWSRITPGKPDWDLMSMKVHDPSSRQLVLKGAGAISPLDIAANGDILFLRDVSATSAELSILDHATGKARKVAPQGAGETLFIGGKFSADGKNILTLSSVGSEYQRLTRINIASGASRPVSSAVRWNVEAFDISADGSTAAYSVDEDGLSQVTLMNLKTGKNIAPPKLPKGVLRGLRFGADGKHLAIMLNRPTNPGDIWAWDATTGKLERWTGGDIGGMQAADLVEPDLIRYRSFDGLSVPAFVYRPKNQGATRGMKAPVIIVMHGGPEEQARPDFNPNFQYWLHELGAAVITPNVRGSNGYGKSYLDLDNGLLRGNAVKDMGALLDWIGQQPDLDANRVVITGQSYGGYMSLSAQTNFSPRLAGGISSSGSSNFVTFLENTEGYRRDLRRVEYGDEREAKMRAYLEEIAPANHAGNIRKPLLVVHGANDPRVPQSEADQIVANVRAAGGDVWYLLAKDEGHGYSKRRNRTAQREVETTFLRRVLKVDSAGAQP